MPQKIQPESVGYRLVVFRRKNANVSKSQNTEQDAEATSPRLYLPAPLKKIPHWDFCLLAWAPFYRLEEGVKK
ncbi:hypothetical protein D3C71_2031770 [compost metagenome]